MPKKTLACVALAITAACGGGGGSEMNAKYPPQKEGCDVQLFQETPTMATDNIGVATASCDLDVSDSDCIRTLKDEVCKLGGNVVWGVDPTPKVDLGKKKLSGRAAHTK